MKQVQIEILALESPETYFCVTGKVWSDGSEEWGRTNERFYFCDVESVTLMTASAKGNQLANLVSLDAIPAELMKYFESECITAANDTEKDDTDYFIWIAENGNDYGRI